ncbi:LANO_0H12596g1_1 [Lachancea nothofagi CBS 11611]|uniref:LANO_0H12596g1_1 n=1 Tax=Lachancea nothofagi CBS 11611 TaxID=1266666 RepID=A0A1G4KMH5_9SACH|nr:LANO_0H12596g1_1 [Lachancea nothofagi CBS 11611]
MHNFHPNRTLPSYIQLTVTYFPCTLDLSPIQTPTLPKITPNLENINYTTLRFHHAFITLPPPTTLPPQNYTLPPPSCTPYLAAEVPPPSSPPQKRHSFPFLFSRLPLTSARRRPRRRPPLPLPLSRLPPASPGFRGPAGSSPNFPSPKKKKKKSLPNKPLHNPIFFFFHFLTLLL